MSYVLPLTLSTDTWQELACPGATTVTLQVFNSAIDVGFGTGIGTARYPLGDEYFAAVVAGLDRQCDAVRFRSHTRGRAAQVAITAR